MEVLVGKPAGKARELVAPPSRCASLDRVGPELVGLPGKALTRDATRRLRFVVHAAGWLHSMVYHGRRYYYV